MARSLGPAKCSSVTSEAAACYWRRALAGALLSIGISHGGDGVRWSTNETNPTSHRSILRSLGRGPPGADASARAHGGSSWSAADRWLIPGRRHWIERHSRCSGNRPLYGPALAPDWHSFLRGVLL